MIIGKLRKNRLRVQRLRSDESAAARKGLKSLVRMGSALSPMRVLIAFGFSVLVVLPAVFGPSPVPYRNGQKLRQPLVARVDFTWKNEEGAERAKVMAERNFAPFYKMVDNWVNSVFYSTRKVMDRAYSLAEEGDPAQTGKAVQDLCEFAKSEKMKLSEKEARILVQEFKRHITRDGLSLYYDLVEPVRNRILRDPLASSGILSDDDFSRDRDRRLSIEHHSGYEKTSSKVGASGGAMSMAQAKSLLREQIDIELRNFSPEFRSVFSSLLEQNLEPSLTYDSGLSAATLTREVESRVKEVTEVKAGEILMSSDRTITPADFERIRAESNAYAESHGTASGLAKVLGMWALLFCGTIGFLYYLDYFENDVFRKPRQIIGLTILTIVVLWILQLGIITGSRVSLVPVGVLAGIAALTFGARAGVGAASLLCYASFVVTRSDIGEVVALLGSSWVFSCLAPSMRDRSSLLRAGAFAGCINFLGIILWRLAGGESFGYYLSGRSFWEFAEWSGAFDALVWVCAGILLTVCLPLVEKVFDTATSISLLELSDQEHPLLRRLLLEAPGTYHHSVVVGNLAESAAETVGANPLLARVGSYYHDIGKLSKPEYFTENDAGVNRHDNLSPTISTLIITSHVKDGVEMARTYKLPQDLVDIIEQHHGDTTVKFFYHRALEAAVDKSEVSEGAFRYPGPRPLSREGAIVLLADSIEAAGRTLSEPTPSRVKAMVHEIIFDKLLSGQLDSSGLTFRDLGFIEDSFVRTVNAMFHSRVSYPSRAAVASARGN